MKNVFSLFLLVFGLSLATTPLLAQPNVDCGVSVVIGTPVYTANGQAIVNISIDGDLTIYGTFTGFSVSGSNFTFDQAATDASINPALAVQNGNMQYSSSGLRLFSSPCTTPVFLPAGSTLFDIVLDLPAGGTIDVACNDAWVSTFCDLNTGQIDVCDLCASNDCGVYVEEVVNGNSVTITLYHDDGTPIAQYNDPCCVTWKGIPGVPTISCPPPPGFPNQSYNPVTVSLGQEYSVTITCGDCVFEYEGVAGDLADGGKAGDRSDWNTRLSTSKANSDQLVVRPNPASDFLQLSSPLIKDNTLIEIRNVQGQLMIAQRANQEQQVNLNLPDFPAGIYLISLQSAEGNTLMTKKFMVK